MAERDQAPEVILPKSFHIPEGDGEDPTEFEAVVTFKLKPGDKTPGKACLIQIGDTKFDYQEPEPEEKKPDYKDMAQGMVKDMTTPVETGGGGMGSMAMGGGY